MIKNLTIALSLIVSILNADMNLECKAETLIYKNEYIQLDEQLLAHSPTIIKKMKVNISKTKAYYLIIQKEIEETLPYVLTTRSKLRMYDANGITIAHNPANKSFLKLAFGKSVYIFNCKEIR